VRRILHDLIEDGTEVCNIAQKRVGRDNHQAFGFVFRANRHDADHRVRERSANAESLRRARVDLRVRVRPAHDDRIVDAFETHNACRRNVRLAFGRTDSAETRCRHRSLNEILIELIARNDEINFALFLDDRNQAGLNRRALDK